jgi:hypothetical protein
MSNSTTGIPIGSAVGAVLFGLAHLFVHQPNAVAVGYTAFTIAEIAPHLLWSYNTTASKLWNIPASSSSLADYPTDPATIVDELVCDAGNETPTKDHAPSVITDPGRSQDAEQSEDSAAVGVDSMPLLSDKQTARLAQRRDEAAELWSLIKLKAIHRYDKLASAMTTYIQEAWACLCHYTRVLPPFVLGYAKGGMSTLRTLVLGLSNAATTALDESVKIKDYTTLKAASKAARTEAVKYIAGSADLIKVAKVAAVNASIKYCGISRTCHVERCTAPRWLWRAPVIVMLTSLPTIVFILACHSWPTKFLRSVFSVLSSIAMAYMLSFVHFFAGIECTQDLILAVITFGILWLLYCFGLLPPVALAAIDNGWDGLVAALRRMSLRPIQAVLGRIHSLQMLPPTWRPARTAQGPPNVPPAQPESDKSEAQDAPAQPRTESPEFYLLVRFLALFISTKDLLDTVLATLWDIWGEFYDAMVIGHAHSMPDVSPTPEMEDSTTKEEKPTLATSQQQDELRAAELSTQQKAAAAETTINKERRGVKKTEAVRKLSDRVKIEEDARHKSETKPVFEPEPMPKVEPEVKPAARIDMEQLQGEREKAKEAELDKSEAERRKAHEQLLEKANFESERIQNNVMNALEIEKLRTETAETSVPNGAATPMNVPQVPFAATEPEAPVKETPPPQPASPIFKEGKLKLPLRNTPLESPVASTEPEAHVEQALPAQSTSPFSQFIQIQRPTPPKTSALKDEPWNLNEFPLPDLYQRPAGRPSTGMDSNEELRNRLLGGTSVLTQMRRRIEAAAGSGPNSGSGGGGGDSPLSNPPPPAASDGKKGSDGGAPSQPPGGKNGPKDREDKVKKDSDDNSNKPGDKSPIAVGGTVATPAPVAPQITNNRNLDDIEMTGVDAPQLPTSLDPRLLSAIHSWSSSKAEPLQLPENKDEMDIDDDISWPGSQRKAQTTTPAVPAAAGNTEMQVIPNHTAAQLPASTVAQKSLPPFQPQQLSFPPLPVNSGSSPTTLQQKQSPGANIQPGLGASVASSQPAATYPIPQQSRPIQQPSAPSPIHTNLAGGKPGTPAVHSGLTGQQIDLQAANKSAGPTASPPKGPAAPQPSTAATNSRSEPSPRSLIASASPVNTTSSQKNKGSSDAVDGPASYEYALKISPAQFGPSTSTQNAPQSQAQQSTPSKAPGRKNESLNLELDGNVAGLLDRIGVKHGPATTSAPKQGPQYTKGMGPGTRAAPIAATTQQSAPTRPSSSTMESMEFSKKTRGLTTTGVPEKRPQGSANEESKSSSSPSVADSDQDFEDVPMDYSGAHFSPPTTVKDSGNATAAATAPNQGTGNAEMGDVDNGEDTSGEMSDSSSDSSELLRQANEAIDAPGAADQTTTSYKSNIAPEDDFSEEEAEKATRAREENKKKAEQEIRGRPNVERAYQPKEPAVKASEEEITRRQTLGNWKNATGARKPQGTGISGPSSPMTPLPMARAPQSPAVPIPTGSVPGLKNFRIEDTRAIDQAMVASIEVMEKRKMLGNYKVPKGARKPKTGSDPSTLTTPMPSAYVAGPELSPHLPLDGNRTDTASGQSVPDTDIANRTLKNASVVPPPARHPDPNLSSPSQSSQKPAAPLSAHLPRLEPTRKKLPKVDDSLYDEDGMRSIVQMNQDDKTLYFEDYQSGDRRRWCPENQDWIDDAGEKKGYLDHSKGDND